MNTVRHGLTLLIFALLVCASWAQEAKDVDVVEHAIQLLQQNHVAQARAELEIILSHEPGNVRAAAYLVTAEIQAGAIEQAVERARKLVEENPKDTDLKALLGRAYAADGDWALAEKEWRAVLEQRPNSEEAHMQLADALLQSGSFTEGLAEVTRALEINPRRADASALKGNILASLGRMDEAVKEWNATLGMDPNNPAALSGLAVYLRGSQPDVALEYARRAVELSNWNSVGPIRILALVYESRNDWGQARQVLDRAIARFPENPMLRAEMRLLVKAESQARQASPPKPRPPQP